MFIDRESTMSGKDESLALLPNGFADLLPPFAQQEAHSIQALMGVFEGFGYLRIKPPLVEFEDSLLAPGPGSRLVNDTFRLMDPVTHRMLGVRSDVTAQVARIVSSRLQNEPRPLRLAYASDVLRTRGSQMRTERQFTQVGCEVVGDAESIETDVEICLVALMGLKALGISDITLDLSVPGFVDAVLAGVDIPVIESVKKSVSQRDVDQLDMFDFPQVKVLAQAMRASGKAARAFDVLDGLDCGAILNGYILRLKTLCERVYGALADLGVDDVTLTIDMVDQDGFEYHKMLGFTLFSAENGAELGRGGCYDVRFGLGDDVPETAKGFTLYMDTIAGCAQQHETRKKVFVSAGESWQVISDLQKQGWIVLRGIGDEDQPPAICSHVYKDGTVIEIS